MNQIGKTIWVGVLASSSILADIQITNSSFESQVTDGVGVLPAGWTAEPTGGFLTLDADKYGYSDNTNGVKGSQVAFNTGGDVKPGTGIHQTIKGEKARDHSTYTMTVGIGSRNFSNRFSGVVLELRLDDGTVLGSQTFSAADVAHLFPGSGGAMEIADAVAKFSVGDVDNTKDIQVAIYVAAAGNGNGNADSLDIDNVRLRVVSGSSASSVLSIGGVSVVLQAK